MSVGVCYRVHTAVRVLLLLHVLHAAAAAGGAHLYVNSCPSRNMSHTSIQTGNGQYRNTLPGSREFKGKRTLLERRMLPRREPHPTNPARSRLPLNIKPDHYNLVLKPDIYNGEGNMQFDGQVDIFFDCINATDVIALNTRNLLMKRESLQVVSYNRHRRIEPDEKLHPKWVRLKEDRVYEVLFIYLDRPLKEGQHYSVRLGFHGSLVHPSVARGFYWSSYKDENNDLRYVAATHFSPAAARRAFPCLDEPSRKATFNVSVWRRRDVTTLSNMPLLNTEQRERGWYVDHFVTTPRMSTYTLAVVLLSGFPHHALRTHQGYTIRVWTQPKGSEYTKYALKAVERLITYFEDYTGIPYGLPKLDLVTLPHHPVRAMENWGLVTYSEASLWHDPRDARATDTVELITTLAHEIAHMWFGNLVTPGWWSELWLKEGVATYLKYGAVRALYPPWNVEELFISGTFHRVLDLDSELGAKSVIADVEMPQQLIGAFTQQAYSKGAVVIRMVRHMLGDEAFHACLKTLLADHMYSTVTREDLWTACNKAAREKGVSMPDGSPLDLGAYMEEWLTQPGYPVVHISYDHVSGVLSGCQKQFLHKLYQIQNFLPVWNVPLTYTSSVEDSSQHLYWVTDSSFNFTIQRIGEDGWIMANINQMAFARISYDDNLWTLLANQLQRDHHVIPVINRAQLLDDALRQARTLHITLAQALDLTLYLSKETEWLPWEAAFRHINKIIHTMAKSPVLDALKEYFLRLILPLYKRLEWGVKSSAGVQESILQQKVLSMACQLRHKHCLDFASRLFNTWLKNGNLQFVPDTRSTILCSGIRHANYSTWNKVFQKLLTSTKTNERSDLLHSLACTQDKKILHRYMDILLTGGIVSDLEAISTISTISTNANGKPLVWKCLEDQWDAFPLGVGKGYILQFISSMFATEKELKQLLNLGKRNKDILFKDIFVMLADDVMDNIAWIKYNEQSTLKWLHRWKASASFKYQFVLGQAHQSISTAQGNKVSTPIMIGIIILIFNLI